jgi:HAD superfamily hydrolase (TIGR01509 family)
MIDSVIFDMDGILFDTERVYANAWSQVGKELNIPDVAEAIRGCIGLNRNDSKHYIMQRYGQQFPYETFRQRLTEIFDDDIKKNGLPQKDGVAEILYYLQQHQYKIALATSTGKNNAFHHLNAAGISHYFQAIVTGDMITHGKPDPEIYLTACEKLGAVPENCFAIEDSPNGIRSAHAAGLKVIMVPDLIQPTAELKKLLYAQFASLLEVKNFFEASQRDAEQEGRRGSLPLQ